MGGCKDNRESGSSIFLECPKCGSQNFIHEKRLKLIDEHPVKCWVCGYKIPTEYIKEKVKNY